MSPFKKCLIAVLFTPCVTLAQPVQTDAYATSGPAGEIWKNPFGLCWRTSAWTPQKALAECDPDLVKKPAPAPVAAPAAAPSPPPVAVPAPPAPPPAPVIAAPATVVAPPPKAVPEVVVLKGVNFATNSAQLTPGSSSTLDQAAAALIRRADVQAEVAGHTDNRGSPQRNRILSQQRAEAVMRYLVSKGVDQGRLSARGYGQESPIADNATDAGRAENRRVELRAK